MVVRHRQLVVRVIPAATAAVGLAVVKEQVLPAIETAVLAAMELILLVPQGLAVAAVVVATAVAYLQQMVVPVASMVVVAVVLIVYP